MNIRYESVRGADFSAQAGAILNDVWAKPSIDYSARYLDWQLTFPSATTPPAIGAFAGDELVGFAAATPRRFRLGSDEIDGFISSFWCLRPGLGSPAAPILLMERFLQALRETQGPVVTFGVNGGRGEKLFPQSYRRIGFVEIDLGILPTYMMMVSSKPDASGWSVEEADPRLAFADINRQVSAQEPQLLSVSPTPAQIDHYLTDPRKRTFLIATDKETGRKAAAWAIKATVRTSNGPQVIPTLDSVIATRDCITALPSLHAAAARRMAETANTSVVNAPSLASFDAASLGKLGIRKTSKGFHARLYLPPSLAALKLADSTAIEVV